MSKKLGQILLDRGAITAAGLELALRNQLMLGGHLGTCLLELGLIDEEALGNTLAESLRVSYAKSDVFLRVDELAVRALRRDVVEEYHAVPFRRNGRSLDVAMIDPRDLPAIDAISFASECKVVPWVAPEVRIFEAMEKLYDIPRRMRYIVISRSLSPLGAAIAREANGLTKPGTQPPPAGIEPQPKAPNSADQGAEYGYGRSWVEIAEELAAKDPSFRPVHDEHAGHELAARLCMASGKDEIADAVLDHARKTMKRAILFSVKGDEIALWDSAGFEPKPEPSAFGTIDIRTLALVDHLLGQSHYHGLLGDSPAHREIYARLGVEAPMEILLVPIHINDRLVALFLGDGGPDGRVEGDARDGLRLTRMLGLALNVIIFKKKIRSLGSFAGHVSGSH